MFYYCPVIPYSLTVNLLRICCTASGFWVKVSTKALNCVRETLPRTVRGSWPHVQRCRCGCHSFFGRLQQGVRRRIVYQVWPRVWSRNPSSLHSSGDSSRWCWQIPARCCCCCSPSPGRRQRYIQDMWAMNMYIYSNTFLSFFLYSLSPLNKQTKKIIKLPRISKENECFLKKQHQIQH